MIVRVEISGIYRKNKVIENMKSKEKIVRWYEGIRI